MLIRGDESHGWSASWIRPEAFEYDGDTIVIHSGNFVTWKASSIKPIKDGFEFAFDDPRPGASPDNLVLKMSTPTTATLGSLDIDLKPFRLIRTKGETPIPPLPGESVYSFEEHSSVNSEMSEIFQSDQKDRQAEHPDWDAIAKADQLRRTRTQLLIKNNKLDSGTDYYNAAFVYQHGDTSSDYMKAHLLALAALARGRADAAWIASATLDRYLLSVGKPQVLGTQFMGEKGKQTQEPFDRALVTDSVRKALHVPTLVDQAKELRSH